MLVATRPSPTGLTFPAHACDQPQKMANTTPATSTATGSATPTAPAKRACDACHRRKVRCIGDGTRPCKNCSSAGLTCTYNAIPQKKGPKGSRAKVISELRETQRQSQMIVKHFPGAAGQPTSPSYPSNSRLLSAPMITTCVDYFFANLYPTQPILHRQKVGETIGQMETDPEAYCLVYSLCAYMMIQPNMELPAEVFENTSLQPQPSSQLGQTLLREALRARKGVSYNEEPSIWSVVTSFFLFGCYFCLDRQNTAWFHLREATTLAQILGMHEESNYQMPDIIESSRRRRLYWLLFITERAYALQQHKPLTLHATINLPTCDEDPSETAELSGFVHLVNLFRPFDDTFVGLWNKSRVGCSTEWLAQLQQQLSAALPEYLHCTESQAVDLRCSQQWLRTMVWQLSISHGYLSSSAAADKSMNFRFPIEISKDLLTAASGFSQASMEVHGIGLIEKLFDIACTLTDVMAVLPSEQTCSPTSSSSSGPGGIAFGPRHYLNQLMTLIGNLRGGSDRYLPVLLKKIDGTMPAWQNGYPLSAIPESIRSYAAEDSYDSNSSHGYNSAPHSGGSSPFGSPLSPEPLQLYGFPEVDVTSSPMQYDGEGLMTFDATGLMYSNAITGHLQNNEAQLKFEQLS